VAYPLPGTPFYERVEAQLGSKRNWDDSDDLDMMYRGPYEAAFYRRLHKAVHAEFRLRRLRERGRLGPRQWAARLFHTFALPLHERALRRLARRPNVDVVALPVALAPERAAIPSEQPGA
jgi:hypothetical protein